MLQSLPLDIKIAKTKLRIREFVDFVGLTDCYISFSGGKDSTVLLDIAREEFPNIKAIYCNTGLEYPEINAFVKTIDNVEIVRPKLSFKEVITKYGYPIVSKEVARAVESTKRWKLDESQYMGSDVKKILGLNNYAKPSRYNLEKWSPLVDALFKISDKCCKTKFLI